MSTQTQFWLIRVGDGVNFRNSKYPFWGVKRGRYDFIKKTIIKMKIGDILCFITSKPHGGKIIGMAEYTGFYDRKDEPLFQIHTKTNKEQNWSGDEEFDIQIQYKNLYKTERQNIEVIIQCSSTILNYETFKKKIKDDLYEHYKNFVFYAEPVLFCSE